MAGKDLTHEQMAGGRETAVGSPTIRRSIIYGVAGLTLILLIGGVVNWALPWLQPYSYHGTVLQATTKTQDFTLDTSTGTPMSLSDFRGQYVLLYFGYTFCPDVCPMTLTDIQTAVAALGDAADEMQVLFVSVDPERDTVEQLATYLPTFNPDFVGMTGDPDMILRAATQFGIFYDVPKAAEGYYTVDHTSTVVVVDPEGYARLVFPYGITGTEMAEDLRHLMRIR